VQAGEKALPVARYSVTFCRSLFLGTHSKMIANQVRTRTSLTGHRNAAISK
jgi:hypothetical protein